MLTPSELSAILKRASVPEHSAGFMQAMSGGEPFLVEEYLFIAAEDWLLAVGYPLEGSGKAASDFSHALRKAVGRTRARDCWAIGPGLPEALRPHRRQVDRYYVLPAAKAPPARLERLAERAAGVLRVEEGCAFTAARPA